MDLQKIIISQNGIKQFPNMKLILLKFIKKLKILKKKFGNILVFFSKKIQSETTPFLWLPISLGTSVKSIKMISEKTATTAWVKLLVDKE